MVDAPPKLDKLISHREVGRILEVNEIGAEFDLIKSALSGDKEDNNVSYAQKFLDVGKSSGTHLLKLVSPRTPIHQHVLRFVSADANRIPDFFPSANAGLAKFCKLVFRPLQVRGHATRSLADHILNPDDQVSPAVMKGFSDAFGEEALSALRKGLLEPLDPITSLPAAQFPIIFAPRPGGGDLQITPVAPAEACIHFRDKVIFEKSGNEDARPRRVSSIQQYLSDKPQNISSAIGKTRTRFYAVPPEPLDRRSAEIYRYVHGGGFPKWRDGAAELAVNAYTSRVLKEGDYSNSNIRHDLDRRADQIIEAARIYIDGIINEAKEAFPDAKLPDPPSITSVILGVVLDKESKARARNVLGKDHFKRRLKAARER